MLEILLLLFLVHQFAQMAFDKGYPRVLWGFIAVASYCGPILLLDLVIVPLLIENGTIIPPANMGIILVGVNLILGVTCCMIAYYILRRMPDKAAVPNPEIMENTRSKN